MDKEIIKLHKDGLSNRDIGRRLNIHHKTVAKYLSENNLRSLGYKNKLSEFDGRFEYKCTKCLKILDREMFLLGRKDRRYEYRFTYCKDCRKKQLYLNLNKNINKFLADKFNRLKLRAKNSNIEFNLDKQFLFDLYIKQKGKCFYTDIEMNWGVGKGTSRNSLSIDRIIYTKGYTKDNIVLCINRVNTIKSDMNLEELKEWIPKWYEKLTKL